MWGWCVVCHSNIARLCSLAPAPALWLVVYLLIINIVCTTHSSQLWFLSWRQKFLDIFCLLNIMSGSPAELYYFSIKTQTLERKFTKGLHFWNSHCHVYTWQCRSEQRATATLINKTCICTADQGTHTSHFLLIELSLPSAQGGREGGREEEGSHAGHMCLIHNCDTRTSHSHRVTYPAYVSLIHKLSRQSYLS